MQDVQVVQVPDALQQVPQEGRYFFLPETGVLYLPSIDQFLEGASSDEFHLDEEVLIGLVEGMELHDVFVVHSFQDLCFFEECSNSGLVHGLFFDHLNVVQVTLTAYSFFC